MTNIRSNTCRFSIVRMFFLIIILPILTSCALNKNNRSQYVSVLNYNIHHALGMDGDLDIQRIANIINTANPDIVALQEIDINTKRNGNVHQLEELAKLTNMNFVFGKSMDWDGGEYGNGVLTKLNIKKHKTYPLPGEPRSALVVTVSANQKEFVFISTHLDNNEKFRIQSIPFIEDILKIHKDKALIFAGDFNATSGSKLMNFLNEKLENATVNLNTIPVDIPNLQIDYIMYAPKNNWEVISSKVIDEKVASDHRPIKAILKLN